MVNGITSSVTSAQGTVKTAAAEPAPTQTDTDSPTAEELMKFCKSAFIFILNRIGAAAGVVNQMLKERIDDINACKDLLQGLKQWNTPPLVPKDPADPLDPAYQDRVDKTDALYLNGITISDSDYDAVKFTYGNPPKTGYSSLPITNGHADGVDNKWVVGEMYNFSETPGSEPKYLVYQGRGNDGLGKFESVDSSLPLNTQHGTDFSSLKPGDLVQDLDTGRYYRISNAKTGVEVTGYPLQKFVQSADDNKIASFDARINERITSRKDSTQGNLLEMQKLNGELSTTASTATSSLGTLGSLMNSIAKGL